jgi:hypothetical protein
MTACFELTTIKIQFTEFIYVGAYSFITGLMQRIRLVSEKFQKFPGKIPGIQISALLHSYGNLASVALVDPGMCRSGGRPIPMEPKKGRRSGLFLVYGEKSEAVGVAW